MLDPLWLKQLWLGGFILTRSLRSSLGVGLSGLGVGAVVMATFQNYVLQVGLIVKLSLITCKVGMLMINVKKWVTTIVLIENW